MVNASSGLTQAQEGKIQSDEKKIKADIIRLKKEFSALDFELKSSLRDLRWKVREEGDTVADLLMHQIEEGVHNHQLLHDESHVCCNFIMNSRIKILLCSHEIYCCAQKCVFWY